MVGLPGWTCTSDLPSSVQHPEHYTMGPHPIPFYMYAVNPVFKATSLLKAAPNISSFLVLALQIH